MFEELNLASRLGKSGHRHILGNLQDGQFGYVESTNRCQTKSSII